jgi:hypothetical protein
MFKALWWIIMLQIKFYGVMVKDLNPHNVNERFKSSHFAIEDYLGSLPS